MQVTFGNPEGAAPVPAQPAQPEQYTQADLEGAFNAAPTQAAAKNPCCAVVAAPSNSEFSVGDLLPSFADIILPRINIIHPSSRLKSSFSEGAVVYGQGLELFTPAVINARTQSIERAATPPLNITVIGFPRPTRYVEKVPFNTQTRGLLADSEAAVYRAGGTLDYQEWKLKEKDGIRYFEPMLDLLVAVARPAHVKDNDTVFSFPVGPDKYTVVLWSCKASAYTAVCKRTLFGARRFNVLRGGYFTHSWNLTTLYTQFRTGNSAWLPVLTPREKSTPEFLAFVKEILNPSTAQTLNTEGAAE